MILDLNDEQVGTIEDALTFLWHRTPARRAEVMALCAATGLQLEGDGPDEDNE